MSALEGGAAAPPLATPASKRLPLPDSYRAGEEHRAPDQLAIINPARVAPFVGEILQAHEQCRRLDCRGHWAEATNRTKGNGGSIEIWYHCVQRHVWPAAHPVRRRGAWAVWEVPVDRA
jgi:hypothetical protein